MSDQKAPELQAAEFATAKDRIIATKNYLAGLPTFFVAVAAALETARRNAAVGSQEREELQALVAAAEEKADTLEALIGEAFSATGAADAADDSLTDAIAPASPDLPPPGPETDPLPDPDPVTDPDPVLDPVTDPDPVPVPDDEPL